MKLYASDLCQCRGADLPTTGRVYLSLTQCARCLLFRQDATTEVIVSLARKPDPPPRRRLSHDTRPNISMREYREGAWE